MNNHYQTYRTCVFTDSVVFVKESATKDSFKLISELLVNHNPLFLQKPACCVNLDASFPLQVSGQSVLGMDAAAPDTLRPTLQLLLQQKCLLPWPTTTVLGSGYSRLVHLHPEFLLHWGCDRLMLWNKRQGCHHPGVHVQSHVQAGRLPLARLRHLRTLFHPRLLLSLHYGGNGTNGLGEGSQSFCSAQDGPQPSVHRLESDSDHLGMDVCLHLCLFPWSISQTDRDRVWPVGVASDISGLVSKVSVTGAPPAAPSKGTETARLSCSQHYTALLPMLQPSSKPNNTLQLTLSVFGSKPLPTPTPLFKAISSYSVLTERSFCTGWLSCIFPHGVCQLLFPKWLVVIRDTCKMLLCCLVSLPVVQCYTIVCLFVALYR